MDKISSETESKEKGHSSDVMMTILKNKIKGLTAEKLDCVSAVRTHAQIQKHVEQTLVDMRLLGNSVSPNGIKTEFFRLPETLITRLFSPRAADSVMSGCLKLI